jgi:hypothetical protein
MRMFPAAMALFLAGIIVACASPTDPCRHVGMAEQMCFGEDCGYYAKPNCYVKYAERTQDLQACEYLKSKVHMGLSYNKKWADICTSTVAIRAHRIDMCYRVQSAERLSLCGRLVNNELETHCAWGQNSFNCTSALPTYHDQMRGIGALACTQDGGCALSEYRYGSCCKYCPQAMSATSAQQAKEWYDLNCPENPDSRLCPSFTCASVLQATCTQGICTTSNTSMQCVNDYRGVTCTQTLQ